MMPILNDPAQASFYRFIWIVKEVPVTISRQLGENKEKYTIGCN